MHNGPDWTAANHDQRVAPEDEELLSSENASRANGDPPIVSKLEDDRKERDVVFGMSFEMGNSPFGRCHTIEERGVSETNLFETAA